MVWLNLDSKRGVDELFARWKQAGATILAEPEDKPWNLREFRVADLDGKQLRVLYDFTRELRQQPPAENIPFPSAKYGSPRAPCRVSLSAS